MNALCSLSFKRPQLFGCLPRRGGVKEMEHKGVKKATLFEQPFGAASLAILAP